MDKFQSLHVFIRVAENGSFSGTAKEFASSQATVSRQISELENHLQTKLLSRTTRQLHLTEAGEKFYKQAKDILEQYDHAVGGLRHLKQQPKGILRLGSPVIFGRKYITPLLPQFMIHYPDIVIEHFLSDKVSDLILEGIDLTIRIGDMKDSTYQARHLCDIRRVTVASKAFIKKHGAPKHPNDLGKMPCVIYLNRPNPFQWSYLDKKGNPIVVNVTGPYRTNVSEGVREAVIAGLGVYSAPVWLFSEELKSGKLVQLLPEFELRSFPLNAVIPASSYIPQKTRVMIEFLVEEFKRSPWSSSKQA